MLNKRPMLLVIAGPNGSGKSTISQYFEKIGKYTNADDMVQAMGISNEEAAVISDESRYLSISKHEDLTFETVLSSDYKLKIIEKAKDEGYFIKCVFVLTVNPMINVSRVESRVASGGHDVDKDKIISRYSKSLANIKRLLELCDILHVYDNSVEPVRIIRKHKEQLTCFPNEIWTEDMIRSLM